jgi:hypothetical protein
MLMQCRSSSTPIAVHALEVAGVVARREIDLRRQTPHRERALEAELEAHGIAALGAPDDDADDLRRPFGELRHRGKDRRVAGGEGRLGHAANGGSIPFVGVYILLRI